MPLKDMLLHINSYPDPTPTEAIDQAVRFAAAIGGTISALAVEIDIKPISNRVADYLIGLSGLAQDEERKSAAACKAGLGDFTSRAQEAGVFGAAVTRRADLYLVGETVAEQARTRDLCIVPLANPADGQRSVAEAVIFDSGRSVLLFRAGAADLPTLELGTVVLAWDGSRAAARAMADALPMLSKARDVVVLSVTNEKPATFAGVGTDAVRHLGAHGVNARASETDAAGQHIGAVLERYVAENDADLLVMGAYGRSRLREFVLGGATEHMLHNPIVPLMLSH